MNIKTQNAINDIYDILQPELKYIIDKINSRPAITKNNYGDYMQLISFLLDGKINKTDAIQLLIKCGGNINGINDAMRVINQ